MAGSVYDDRPFEWVQLDSAAGTYPALFRKFLAGLPAGDTRCEIGCGPGRNLAGLRDGAALTIGLDLSFVSARKAAVVAHATQGSALELPFRDSSFSAVVLDGVAHHTPDPRRAVQEAVRITRATGWLYVAVYKTGTLYSVLYPTIGALLRAVDRFAWGRLLNEAIALWLYRPAHYLKRGVWRSSDAARNLYSDYFLTPIASFHSREEVVGWIERAGATVSEIDEFLEGNCRLVIARRNAHSDGA